MSDVTINAEKGKMVVTKYSDVIALNLYDDRTSFWFPGNANHARALIAALITVRPMITHIQDGRALLTVYSMDDHFIIKGSDIEFPGTVVETVFTANEAMQIARAVDPETNGDE